LQFVFEYEFVSELEMSVYYCEFAVECGTRLQNLQYAWMCTSCLISILEKTDVSFKLVTPPRSLWDVISKLNLIDG